jgi:glycerol-3-phosphate acyltransferase PlsY
VMLTGYVGLGTILGTASLPVYFALSRPVSMALLCFALLMSLFIAYTHRGNIERMRQGSENRARRLWLLRPR